MKTKVIISDPSKSFRLLIKEILTASDYEIIALTEDGQEVINLIKKGNIPNLLITELEMPIVNGFELLQFIKSYNEVNKQKIIPIVITNFEKYRRDAFRLKARQFLVKKTSSTNNISYYTKKIIPLLDMVQIEKKYQQSYTVSVSKSPTPIIGRFKAIAIGVSTGGPKAINRILPTISARNQGIPIFIVQHMPKGFTERFASNLDNTCQHRVVEVSSTMELNLNTIYIAKGGTHMVLRGGTHKQVGISDTPPENNCKPSVDVFLRTFADVYKNNGLTIILTGMGNDGSKSLSKIKENGGTIFVQDEESSVVWGMPGSAVNTGFVDKIISLDFIPDEISKVMK